MSEIKELTIEAVKRGVTSVDSLLNLLADNFDDLPESVKHGLDVIVRNDGDFGLVIGVDELVDLIGGYGELSRTEPVSKYGDMLCSVDRIRRTAYFWDGDLAKKVAVEFDSFSLISKAGEMIKLW